MHITNPGSIAAPVFLCKRLAHDIFDDVTDAGVQASHTVADAMMSVHRQGLLAAYDNAEFARLQHLMHSQHASAGWTVPDIPLRGDGDAVEFESPSQPLAISQSMPAEDRAASTPPSEMNEHQPGPDG